MTAKQSKHQSQEELHTSPEFSETDIQENYQEKWQRAMAEIDNMKKRETVERQSFAKFNLESFIEELLPVIDNFYRATEHIPTEQKDSAWVTGIQYIQKNLLDVLENRGVSEINAKPGEAFDPHQHEAIGVEASDQYPEDTIVRVQNRGYRLHDRVLRPAQVIVSKSHQ